MIDVNFIYILKSNLSSFVILNLNILSLSLSINSTMFINENSSLLFNDCNIHFISKYSMYIYNNSLINLNGKDSNTLFFKQIMVLIILITKINCIYMKIV